MTCVSDDNNILRLGKPSGKGRAADTPNGTGINSSGVPTIPQPISGDDGMSSEPGDHECRLLGRLSCADRCTVTGCNPENDRNPETVPGPGGRYFPVTHHCSVSREPNVKRLRAMVANAPVEGVASLLGSCSFPLHSVRVPQMQEARQRPTEGNELFAALKQGQDETLASLAKAEEWVLRLKRTLSDKEASLTTARK